MSTITVYKLDPAGQVTWQYQGQILSRTDTSIVIEATFNHADMPFQGITLKRNDRYMETFFSDRWYNIFEIFDRDDGHFKGWYCNIGRPAILEEDSISYIDLALDLWVTPDCRQTVLDEDEFSSLELDRAAREQALHSLRSLQRQFRRKKPPGTSHPLR